MKHPPTLTTKRTRTISFSNSVKTDASRFIQVLSQGMIGGLVQ